MKKLIASLLLATPLAALPVGNPSEASLLCDGLIWEGSCADPCDPCLSWCDAFSFRVGFYGDYVFNRHLKITQDVAPIVVGKKVGHAELFTNAGYLAANLWDRIDLFTTLGASNSLVTAPLGSFLISEIETTTAFSWSIGGRATLWECGCTALGIEGQYFRANPRVRRLTLFTDTGTASVYPDDTLSFRYQEWQVGLGLSHRIHMFVPYIAVKWAGCRASLRGTLFDGVTNPATLKNDKRWGYAVGVSLVDCKKIALTVEGRFADEKAIYVNGQIRF